MAIRNLFKKNDSNEENPVKQGSLPRAKKQGKEAASNIRELIAGVLLRAHFTEKTARGGEHNSYAFKVRDTANKFEIKRAVEGKYGVTVELVRTMNTKEKARRRGSVLGWKSGFKKAIVTIKEGQKIEIQ